MFLSIISCSRQRLPIAFWKGSVGGGRFGSEDTR
jgi:lipid-A-disaccharide synthase-like uncharacterized protein